MQTANQSAASSESPRANGHTQLHELFALTDEQILEIDPEPQDATVIEDVAQGVSPAVVASSAEAGRQASEQGQSLQTQSPQAGVPVLQEPPVWLAERMNDPQSGAEARALWESAQRAEREATSYREVFAKPEDARTAAERARVLDDIDRAYFAGDASQRAQLAAMMMREDPAAFREMVFEGLRALEEAGNSVRARSVADALTRPGTAASNTATSQASRQQQTNIATQVRDDSTQQAQLAAYAAFERSANEDLERSVGSAIERTLEQALPAAGRPDSAALKGRMTAAIRQDVEKALQGDRQLGEQVAQILSAKRLDAETRTRIVQLIGERAQQLVPSATRRALNDWTQTTLAAHRGRSAHADVTPAVAQGGSSAAASAKDAARAREEKNRGSVRTTTKSGRMNYQKLSDEQILDL
ncbi:MAG: hypothetical protein ACRD51_04280 [Candidatus Acidiferrum sp.]